MLLSVENGGRLEYSRLMGRCVWLVVLAVGLGLAVACGAGGAPVDRDGEPVSTETPRSERTEREATIMQQQEGQTVEQVPVQVGEQERGGEQDAEEQAVAAGEIDFGHRKGLPFNRNVVGDPDAPVVIVEYSDFQ